MFLKDACYGANQQNEYCFLMNCTFLLHLVGGKQSFHLFKVRFLTPSVPDDNLLDSRFPLVWPGICKCVNMVKHEMCKNMLVEILNSDGERVARRV